MIKIYPVKCEAVDETDEVVFTMDAFDAECFTLDIKILVDAGNWTDIAKSVESALAYMSAGLTVVESPEMPDT